MIPRGMTLQDAEEEYMSNKKVITGNDGILNQRGIECQDCYKTFSKDSMIDCPCDGPICKDCSTKSRCFDCDCVEHKLYIRN